MDDIIYDGVGVWRVLSSDGSKYYVVVPSLLKQGKKPCNCPAVKLECKHLQKVATYNGL